MSIGVAVKAGNRGDEEGEGREDDQRQLQRERAPVDARAAPEGEGSSEHEEDVRSDASRQGPADDVRKPLVDREQRDDELGGVPERRVEEAADSRASVLAGVLGCLAD
jgi:hypothetical protein